MRRHLAAASLAVLFYNPSFAQTVDAVDVNGYMKRAVSVEPACRRTAALAHPEGGRLELALLAPTLIYRMPLSELEAVESHYHWWAGVLPNPEIST